MLGGGQVGAVAVAAGSASIAATGVAMLEGGLETATLPVVATAVDVAVQLVLVALVCARSRGRDVLAAVPPGLASALWVLRFGELEVSGSAVLGVGAWAGVAGVAASTGLAVRMAARRRERAVAEARRAQRLHLAAELHDVVAHDVSEMVAQAQAAQVVLDGIGSDSPARLVRGIEQAGTRALDALDRTIAVLHEASVSPPIVREAPDREGLLDLAEVAARFTAVGGPVVAIDARPALDATSWSELNAEVAQIARRIVVEALTNVRRHAVGAAHVTVAVALDPGELRLTVADDGSRQGGASPPREHGGRGLTGLAERVRLVGGAFDAAAVPGSGWRVHATLPLEPLAPGAP